MEIKKTGAQGDFVGKQNEKTQKQKDVKKTKKNKKPNIFLHLHECHSFLSNIHITYCHSLSESKLLVYLLLVYNKL